MIIKRFKNNDKLNESIINSSSFSSIKVKSPCKKKLFEEYPNDSFIVVLDEGGKVIMYESDGGEQIDHNKKRIFTCYKNTFENLREFISLYGSEFFNYPLSGTILGNNLIKYYENKTGMKVREIYKYEL